MCEISQNRIKVHPSLKAGQGEGWTGNSTGCRHWTDGCWDPRAPPSQGSRGLLGSARPSPSRLVHLGQERWGVEPAVPGPGALGCVTLDCGLAPFCKLHARAALLRPSWRDKRQVGRGSGQAAPLHLLGLMLGTDVETSAAPRLHICFVRLSFA